VIKHVDVIAIALLLGAAALYSGARNLAVVHVNSYQRIALSQAVHRAFKCSRAAKAQSTCGIARALAVPVPRVTIASE
jgi:hypothetical protein